MQNKKTENLLYFIYSFTIITAIVISIVTIFGTLKLINSPREIHIPVSLNVSLEDQGHIQFEGKPNLDIDFTQVRGNLVYKDDNPTHAPIAWAEIFFPLVRIVFFLFIVLLTAKIMQTSIKEEPFIDGNAKRLKWIGYSLLIMGALRHIGAAVELHLLRNHLVSQYVTIDDSTTGYAMGKFVGNLLIGEFPVGLFILFIAALFKHGIAIRKENELTI